jgi:hypothetical protein
VAGVAANAAPASRTRHISAESRCDSIASLLKTELWEGADFARGDEQRGNVLKPILCGGAVSTWSNGCTVGISLLSPSHVEDFYRESHRECCLHDKGFPAARSVQQLVQAWKELRKWRK